MAHLHIVRQPVFSCNKSVFAYRLLYMPEGTDANTAEDADAKSLRVLTAGFLGVGIGTMTGGKPALVNFTQYMLEKEMATIFPQGELYIQVDSGVRPEASVLEALKTLKEGGYRLVISQDDFQPHSILLDFADIIKVNYASASDAAHRKNMQRFSGNPQVKFLADGIESERDFANACKAGFSLFQGYFFTRPAMIDVRTVPVSKLNLMLLLTEIVREDPDVERIRASIEMDVGLSYEILKLVNSAYFYRRNKLSSIRGALAYLGIQGIKKWVMLSALSGQSEANDEAVELSILRSRFMEQLGTLFVYGNKIEEYTLTGLFSLLEAITCCPFTELLGQINVPEEVYVILAEGKRDTLMGQCFSLMEAYEKGDFTAAANIANKLGFTLDQVESMYKASLRWLYENRASV